MITIEKYKEEFSTGLAKFLNSQNGATVFHEPDWHRVIESTYGHKTDYWVAQENGEIVGIFPVNSVRFPLLGTKMVAMAYQFHSGFPLANDPLIQKKLIEYVIANAHESGAMYFEIRHYESVPILLELGFTEIDSQLVTTSAPLDGLDISRIRRGHRRNIIAAKDQKVLVSKTDSLSDLAAFRKMYLLEGQKLGNPSAGWNYFKNLKDNLGSCLGLWLAIKSGQILGGLLTVDNGRSVFARCGAYTSSEALKLHIGKALIWEAMSETAQRGCKEFNFGMTWRGDSELIHHKEGWNGITRQAFQYVYPIRSKAPAPGRYFEGYKFSKAVWKRLPFPIVDWAGKIITRWVC